MRRLLALTLLLAALPGFAQPANVVELKARLQNLDQHLEAWDLASAKEELTALQKLAEGEGTRLHFYRGRVAFEEGRYADAIADFTAAGQTEEPNSWLTLAKNTHAVVKDHLKVESEHFIFLYPKGKDEVLSPWALEALEASRAALQKDLGFAPKEKIRVEVVSNATELSKVSTLSKEAIRTTGTIAICKWNKLMVTSPRAVIKGYDWLDTLAHEYVHLVVSRKSHNRVPIWMHEGLAKYLESRWRGPAGDAITPSTLALLGSRVKKGTLVPFEKMHPSMALLPTAEDAATAFAEVFFAIDFIHQQGGAQALATMLDGMSKGQSDKAAVEAVTRRSWSNFEKAWMAHLKKQPFPGGLIPRSSNEKKELAENAPGKAQAQQKADKRQISFGDFAEVNETEARRDAHLGELLRERNRMAAAAEAYGRAHVRVGDLYESISNKYALALFELKRFDDAEKVLRGSLTLHPGAVQTNVHLGRIAVMRKRWPQAKAAYTQALAVNPFDAEVHLGLLKAALATKDAALAQRAVAAAVALTGLTAAQLEDVAQAMGGAEALQDDPLPQVEATPAPAVDAG